MSAELASGKERGFDMVFGISGRYNIYNTDGNGISARDIAVDAPGSPKVKGLLGSSYITICETIDRRSDCVRQFMLVYLS